MPVDWRPPPAGSAGAVAAVGRRPPAGRGQPDGGRPHDRGPAPAGRRRPGGRGGRHRAPPAAPRRTADRRGTPPRGPLRGAIVGACLLRGLGRHARGRRDAGRLRGHRAGALPRPRRGRARWPAIVSPSMPMWVARRRRRRAAPAAARSTRAWARSCATAPSAPASSTGCGGWQRVLGPVLAPALRRHGPVDVGRADRLDGGRWATRATTATGPGTSLLVRALAPDLVRTVDDASAGAEDVADVLRLRRRQRPLPAQRGHGRRRSWWPTPAPACRARRS